MTPHAPTTAELRLFRQRTGIQHDGGIRCATFWHPKGAHDYERRDGIGAVSDDPYKRGRLDGCAIHARREASAMRSRAFEAIRADALGDAGLADDLEAAMRTFEPCPHCTGGGIGCCASAVESITR